MTGSVYTCPLADGTGHLRQPKDTHKLRRILAALALTLGPLVVVIVTDAIVEQPPVSAWAYNCHANMSSQAAWAACDDSFNNGGINQMRVVLECKTWPGSIQSIIRYGAFVPVDYYSTVTCMQQGYYPYSVTYQLR